MATNKCALIRYITIDKRLRTLTKSAPKLSELLELCKEKTGMKTLGLRAVQKDIQDMRYDSGLQLYAPIVVVGKGSNSAYRYLESDYSIAKAIEKL